MKTIRRLVHGEKMEQGIWNSGVGETVILNRKIKVSLSKKKKKMIFEGERGSHRDTEQVEFSLQRS